LEGGFPDKSNENSLLGSTAHRVGEKCLLSGHDASYYIGRDTLLECGHLGHCDSEMADAVQVYLDVVRGLAKKVGAKIQVEVPLKIDWINKELTGTADCVIADDLMETLYVGDYKHGVGVTVECDDNPQLRFYALAAAGKPQTPEKYQFVVPFIVQPRGHHANGGVRFGTPIPIADLRAWGEDVLRPAYRRCRSKTAEAIPGDHCRFCKAMAVCPGMHKAASDSAMMVFEEADQVPQSPVTMPVATVSRVLGYADAIRGWLDAVEDRARTIILEGGEVPGFKVVEGSSHRKWSSDSDAETFLVAALGSEAHSKKILTVAQAEKALKVAKIQIPTELITKPRGGPILAPQTDRRPEFKQLTAQDAFKERDE
jgi:hypothetical protein